MAEQLTTFASGAQSSGDVARFDLVPRGFLERVARRFGLGAKKYGDQAYRAGLADRAFILERLNHAQQHLQALMAPKNAEEWDDDNLAALGWFCAFMTEVEAHPEGKLILNVIREERGCEQPGPWETVNVVSSEVYWRERYAATGKRRKQ
jgi:hypothetical protein